MASSSYEVNAISDVKIPRIVRFKLKEIVENGDSGVLLYGIIRTPARSMSRKSPIVSVNEGGRSLAFCSSHSNLPKFVGLNSANRKLSFQATRESARVSSSGFFKKVTLGTGSVLVAICEPVQPWTFYAKSPERDTWYIGTIDSTNDIAALSLVAQKR